MKLVFNFDSSGTLKTQIQEGAACDLFISAGQKQMDQMDASADPSVNTEGLDFVLEDSRIDILENKVTLCVSESSKIQLTSFDDMAAALKEGTILWEWETAMCPVGQYTQKILGVLWPERRGAQRERADLLRQQREGSDYPDKGRGRKLRRDLLHRRLF